MIFLYFLGRPYFTTDTAGFAVVKKGTREVAVVFDKEYLEQPIVNASISLDETIDATQSAAVAEAIFGNDTRYLIAKKSTKGFTVLLNKSATEDIQFSWTAFAVKGAKTFESIDTASAVAPVPEPTLEPSPVPAPEPAPEITPGSTSEITSDSEPAVEAASTGSSGEPQSSLESAPALEPIPIPDSTVPTEATPTTESSVISS